MYLTRNQAWAQVHRGFESHPLRQKEKAPLGALSFCGESEHARGWDSKRRACKRGAGRIPHQMYIEKIRSDEQASGVQGVSHHNDQRQSIRAHMSYEGLCILGLTQTQTYQHQAWPAGR